MVLIAERATILLAERATILLAERARAVMAMLPIRFALTLTTK